MDSPSAASTDRLYVFAWGNNDRRDDLATWVLQGEGPQWSLPMVLDELCRILADEVPDAR